MTYPCESCTDELPCVLQELREDEHGEDDVPAARRADTKRERHEVPIGHLLRRGAGGPVVRSCPDAASIRKATALLRKAYGLLGGARDFIGDAAAASAGLTRTQLDEGRDACTRARDAINDALERVAQRGGGR